MTTIKLGSLMSLQKQPGNMKTNNSQMEFNGNEYWWQEMY